MRRAVASAVLVAILLIAVRDPAAQALETRDVLPRIARYIASYVPRLANTVAQEQYGQDRTGRPPLTRGLVSDFLLVSSPMTENEWMVFRDVATVDGQAVPDKAERLLDLFVSPSGNAIERVRRIAAASLQFHLPGGTFTVTNPLAVVAALQEPYQARLRFSLGGEAKDFGPDVRVLRFEEPPLTLTQMRASDPPLRPIFGAGARGSVWVEPETGRVLQTEFRVQVPIGISRRTIVNTTTFAPHAGLGILVPSVMTTVWPDPQSGRDVNGVAIYTNYRRFEVKTDTELRLPPAPAP